MPHRAKKGKTSTPTRQIVKQTKNDLVGKELEKKKSVVYQLFLLVSEQKKVQLTMRNAGACLDRKKEKKGKARKELMPPNRIQGKTGVALLL